MKKEGNLFSQFIIPFIVLLFISCILFNCFICLKTYTSAARLNCLQSSHEIMRIKIYGSSYSSSAEGNTVSASISIIDSNGNEISAIERSWSGSYLGASFAKISLYGKNFIFPMNIYGKKRIADNSISSSRGTKLEKYYNDDRQCMLLGHGSSYQERKSLYWISVFATKKYPIAQFSMVDYINLDLSGCKSEVYYSVICDENGNISVLEL
ncbi:MAG: hypothetical protein K5681_03375 [Treponema sp.]|nr:hypothetical protein [Treponema sp.]